MEVIASAPTAPNNSVNEIMLSIPDNNTQACYCLGNSRIAPTGNDLLEAAGNDLLKPVMPPPPPGGGEDGPPPPVTLRLTVGRPRKGVMPVVEMSTVGRPSQGIMTPPELECGRQL